ncbi:HAD family hydrolase [Mucisphaera calidilacus]|uniref:Phosphorylated carbohydrates phosphatase n=1 Tax=Mucisphaera calidilacus TaxID=2527982 RepID=A0A518C0R8_9BACT|nr:HAD family phosphatase [Mucisphaera calidilacus]QDU72817.1 Phosphorylated carbohydrates phosphatase [Mucisphaera calidilacus]
MIQGVIFDFDGVLADSEMPHCHAMLDAVADRGIRFDEDHYRRRYIGFDDRDAFRAILTDFGFVDQAEDHSVIRQLVARKQVAFDRIVARGIPLVPGSFELARALRDDHRPIAIASGATRSDIEGVLRFYNHTDLFPVIVTADDVEQSKPHPQTYALALQNLQALCPDHNLTPDNTLAIEDTAAGLRSARDAGLRRLGLTTNQPAHELTDAEHILPNLVGISPEHISNLFMEPCCE